MTDLIRRPSYTPSGEQVIGPYFKVLGTFFPVPTERVVEMIGEYNPDDNLSDVLRQSFGWRLDFHGRIDIVPGLPLIGFKLFEESYSYDEDPPDEKMMSELEAAGIVCSQTDIITGGRPSRGISRWRKEPWTRVSNGHHEAICIEFEDK